MVPEKINSIQVLRGLAASMVCFCHFATASPLYLPDGNLVKEVGHHMVYGVQIFFVISGFVLPYSLAKAGYTFEKFGNFLLRRVVRLDPPYLLSIFIAIVVGYISSLTPFYRSGHFSVNWTDVALHFGYLNGFFDRPWQVPVYWTLAIEFQFYILLGLLYTPFQKSGIIGRALIVIAFLAAGLLLQNHAYIFCYAPLFFMGIFSFMFYEKKLTAFQFVAAIAICYAVGCFSFGTEPLTFGLCAVPAIFFFNTKNRQLLFLGNISYSLYLLHVPIGVRVSSLIESLTSNVALRLLGIPLAFAVSILAAWLFYRFVEQPAIRWSKAITKSRPPTAAIKVTT